MPPRRQRRPAPNAFQARLVQYAIAERPTKSWSAPLRGACVDSASATALGPNGYRATWVRTHGPVPSNVVLHHACENRRCVNIDHLHPMSQDEHVLEHRYLSWSRGAEAYLKVKGVLPPD